MRSLLIILFMVLYTVFSLPLWLVAWIVRKTKGDRAAHAFSQPIVNFGWRALLFLAGSKVEVVGKENIPDEPVLFVSNHRSYWDIMVIYISTPHLTGFVSKKQIGKIPMISTWMKFMHAVFLDRKDIRKDLEGILQAIDYVKDGYSMFIAPEGTRGHGDELLPFRDGSFKIAQRSGCKIVPVACIGTDNAYELHRPWVRPAKIALIYGEPVDMKTLDPENRRHIGTYVRNIIQQMYTENKYRIE